MKTSNTAKVFFAGVALSATLVSSAAIADQMISAMIPVLSDPDQPRTVLTAPVSTIVGVTVDCERWCLHEGFNNPAVVCGYRGGPSVIGTTLPPGSYFLSIGRGTGEGVCTGHVRVTP